MGLSEYNMSPFGFWTSILDLWEVEQLNRKSNEISVVEHLNRNKPEIWTLKNYCNFDLYRYTRSGRALKSQE